MKSKASYNGWRVDVTVRIKKRESARFALLSHKSRCVFGVDFCEKEKGLSAPFFAKIFNDSFRP